MISLITTPANAEEEENRRQAAMKREGSKRKDVNFV
jgi:hypothetical protein